MPSSAIASPASIERPRLTARFSAPVILLLLAFGAVWFICFRHLSAEWSYNEQYNYGWFVPFFALYLFWLRWEDRPQPQAAAEAPSSKLQAPKRRALFAGLIAISALLLLLPIRLIEVANPDWRSVSWLHALAAVTLTLLVIWWLGGMPWLRHFAFPVGFVLIAVPWLSVIEQPIIQGLMPTLASIATEILSLFGIPAQVEGNLIRINGGLIGVDEACSGVRSLQTSIMIGLLFGELKRLTLLRRISLLLIAVGIAFIANVARALFLVWIAATRGIPEVEHWHDIAGYAIVGVVFFGCLGVTAWLAKGKVEGRKAKVENGGNPRSAIRNPQFSVPLPTFYFLLSTFLWLVAVEVGVELWYRAHERNLRPSAQWSVRWPESAPQFRELRIDDRAKRVLHYDEGRGARWRDGHEIADIRNYSGGDAICLLYFFRWQPGHNSALLANAHRPDVCLPATGWRQKGDYGVREYEIGQNLAIPFRHFQFSNEASGRSHFAHAFYCVWEDRVPQDNPGKQSAGMSGQASTWTRRERIEAVIEGHRHLGQQVMEYLLIEPKEISPTEAEDAFVVAVRKLVVPEVANHAGGI